MQTTGTSRIAIVEFVSVRSRIREDWSNEEEFSLRRAGCYRFRPRPSKAIRKRRELVTPEVAAIAEKAEQRLARRYQHLTARGLKPQKVVMAVARELAGFVWAIAQEVRSQAA